MNSDYYKKIKDLNISHYSGEISYYTQAPLRNVEKKLLTSIPKQSRILDVGCGSGRFTIGAAQMGHNVTGIDITPAAITAAAEKAKKLNLGNVNFLVGDMTDIPFRNSEFDYVFCPRFSINAVATFEKRKKAIEEMVRVVKPEGVVYIESFNKLYLGRGPVLPLRNLFSDFLKQISIFWCWLTGKQYTGLLLGDIVYKSNKVADAPEGYAHLLTIFELKRLLPKGITYKFYSIPQILKDQKSFDLMKYFRYSIWIFLSKPGNGAMVDREVKGR
jgi:ubiquinone/menaquinone biosynthesis C-methylase UbiE